MKARIRSSTEAAALSPNSGPDARPHDYSDVWSGLPVGLYQSTPEGQILDANPTMVRMLGYPTREALLAIRAGDLYVNLDDRQQWQAMIERERVLVDFETQYRRYDGSQIWVQDRARAVFNPQGRVEYYVGILTDITARKQSEEVLLQSEERYRSLFERATDAIFTIDLKGNFTSVNAAAERLSGYPRAEALQKNITDVLGPEHLETARAMMAAKLGGQEATTYELELVRKDGRRVPVEISTTLVQRNGMPVGIQGIGRDMSERKLAEEQVKRHLNRLTALRAIDLAIASSLDLSLALNVVLEQATTQLQVDAAAILLLNPHNQVLEVAAARGFLSDEIGRTRLRLGEGLAGRAALERRLMNSPNLPEAGRTFTRGELLKKERFVAYHAAPLVAKGQIEGVLEVFHRSPLHADHNWLDFFKTLAGQAAIAVDNVNLFANLQTANLELKVAYDHTLEGWVRALDLRDKETEGHTQRVTDLTVRLARSMGVPEADLIHVYRGALLHDIGKMAIPDAVLLKPGPLTPEERKIIEQHPIYAYEFLSSIPYLRPALDIPYCHHEKWDGTGYPRGLKGEQIPQVARIFAVVDVWDALRSDRIYRKGWPEDKVRQYIRDQAGQHFDPRMSEIFLAMEP